MADWNGEWVKKIADALASLASEKNLEINGIESRLKGSKPPKADMGDIAFPLFPFAKDFRMGPPQLAGEVVEKLGETPLGKAVAAGPYVNVFLERAQIVSDTLKSVLEAKGNWGNNESLKGRKIMIEFSSPNTNKPLHLGHLRNDALGESTARILKANGADVQKVILVNDRGVHICKSMLAYEKFGQGETPESSGIKGDRLVGDYYVKFAQWAKEDNTAEEQAQEMLQKWEAGDDKVQELWKTMNKWTLDGIAETYKKTNVSFDKYYYESQLYKLGKENILKGLEEGTFYKDKDGSTRVDMSEIGLDTKVLLRSDGTSVYITQDIGTAISRQSDWPFDQLIYVVGNEQDYHFQVLFYVLKKLGYTWAEDLYHLSYGMVNLPEGKMKSREGTVVDADMLLVDLSDLALEEIKTKGREEEVDDARAIADAVSLAALHYYLLQVTPKKDMIFNPKESLSFNGNTGPYLQYMAARISSMERKATAMGWDTTLSGVDGSLLKSDEEWELVGILADFPRVVEQAGTDHNPSLISGALYNAAKIFSRYYHDNPILNNEDESLAKARLQLSLAVLEMLKKGFDLINIPYLAKM
ncbi:MAG: arginine--tRNA ligase [Spirochaetales bacterium]|nr:arginine--tRNA ligase [Spirochaetales bacterium]